jgi:capsular exopolysaccharide synthesis family protein
VPFLKWRRRQRAGAEDAYEHYSPVLVTILEPDSAASEAYRILRTNLLHSSVDNPHKVVVLTSPDREEGKSTTCANLGVVLAQTGNSTLLLDCDLRKPRLHRFFDLRNVHGVVNVVAQDRSLQEVWTEPLPGLKVVSAGPMPPSPAELLTSQRFSQFLASVREEFDYVLLDTPPVNLFSDPAIIASRADGVLLIIDAQTSRKISVRHSMRSLEAVGANVLGTVMNSVKVPTKPNNTYDYYQ